MALSETPTGSTGQFSLFSGTVYLKETPTFDPFEWGGRCMRIDGDTTETLQAMTVTHRQNPRGGVERDGIILDPPAEASLTLMMKHRQASRKKTELRTCLWIIDERQYCKDKDFWNGWDEITRYCTCAAGSRTVSGTGYDPSDEEAMIGLPETCLFVEDIYRVSGEEHLFPDP